MAFGNLTPLATDPVLALMGAYRADPRPHKIDLGVGVYRDAQGQTPVFAAVKQAEARLLASQTSKSYLGSDGDQEFVVLLGERVLGERVLGERVLGATRRFAGLQTLGGTGALRLAGDLLARSLPGRRIWLGLPSWPNHLPIFAASGLATATVDSIDTATGLYDPEAILAALDEAAPGDAVLIQACCHNPTGVDPEPAFWDRLTDTIVARGLVPLVDMAYQGLGRGWDRDAAALRPLIARAPHLMIAYSCDKNFGLYRDRVGALFVAGETAAETHAIKTHLAALARANYSMPADHGAAIVRLILQDEELTAQWFGELETMRLRLHRLRAMLAAYGMAGDVDLGSLADGQGMFATLPLPVATITRLQAEHGIYMAPSGRINIAGLAEDSIDRFVQALLAVQHKHAA